MSELFDAAWRAHRHYLVDLAYRMLGDVGEAEDAVQEAFARLARAGEVDDARGWLTVVTSRLCLDRIRSARSRRERPAAEVEATAPGLDPADRVTLDDEVRLALSVVLERLGPAERVVFVLHDVFRMPFDEIAETVGRPAATCRQLARRARLRIAEAGPAVREVDPAERRAVVERFLAACGNGDVEGLLTVLHPQVWGTADLGPGSPIAPQVEHGAGPVARTLVRFWRHATLVSHPAGDRTALLAFVDRRLVAIIDLTVDHDRVTRVDVTAEIFAPGR